MSAKRFALASALAAAFASASPAASTNEIRLLDGERWFGGAVNLGAASTVRQHRAAAM